MGERKWYHLSGDDTGPGLGSILARLNSIDNRLDGFDRRLAMVEQGPMADQARGGGDPYYHRSDASGVAQKFVPFVSTRARFAESLTSPAMVKTIIGEALVLGLSFAGLGLAAHLGFDIPVRSIPALAIGGAALSGLVLVLVNRGELHRLITAQGNAGQRSRSRSELYIQVNRPDPDGKLRSVQFLLVAGITVDQLSEWARRVLDGASLAVKSWSGAGCLFSEGQYTSLMTELERAGYVLPGHGNTARTLHPRLGPALLRQCVKLGKPE